jgi:pyridinium-3,5-biscarboxylic acid mononucleotide synthase
MDLYKLLEQVKNNEIEISEAETLLKKLPYEDLGFAKLDHHRSLRSGFGEVVFCQGKDSSHLKEIFIKFYEHDTNVLGTRASREQYEHVKEALPMVEYDPISRILSIQRNETKKQGCIAVCTGGTSDFAVAEEAAQTAEFFGSKVLRFYDVGVAGIHRLFSKIDEIRTANCIIAVAGMEGALGGVVSGLVDKPVIGVPTSIGYGANFGGLSALLTMLNSCAEGMSVVNIDNGFGAGYIATQINRLKYENEINK